jgi:radical SAM superfamily enzyme YgiQ (UPF0313 family)
MQKKVVVLFFPLIESSIVFSNYPWAILYLERMIRDLDVEVILLDERLDKNYDQIILKVLDRLLFVGVSSMVGSQIVHGVKFSEFIKQNSAVPVIWGGWFPTVFPEMILNDTYADYICVGQGEIPIREFTIHLLEQKDPSKIKGVGCKINGEIVINPYPSLTDPKEFPRPDLSLININKLIDINGIIKPEYREADYLASIGCYNHCSFCNMVMIFGKKWFAKSTEEIFSDLTYMKEYGHISHITFADDNFFASKSFVMKFCHELNKSTLGITWEANAHIGYFLNHFTEEDIKYLVKSGCTRIKLGAESGDQEVLDSVKKKLRVEETLMLIKALKKHKIHVRLFTMICFPFNPDRDFIKTMNMIGRARIIHHSLDANIKFYIPIPKTPLYDFCVENGFSYPETTKELITIFSDKFTSKFKAPWYNRDYRKELDDFQNFYFLFASPTYYKNFPKNIRFFVFILNSFLYPIIYLRFKFNIMRFPIEARIFKKIIKFRTDNILWREI